MIRQLSPTTVLMPVLGNNTPGRLAPALVHELRNPLTNIKLAVALIEPSLGDSDPRKGYLEIIKRNTERINVLVEGLLKNQQENKRQAQKYSLLRLLDEVIELVKDRIILKNVIIKKNYSADFTMALNEAEIRIALTNIIINAIEAMPPGKGELKLITKSSPDKSILMIKDNGCGINKQNLEKIFTPFFTNTPGGLGVGLAATSEILRSNHVLVNVKSKEGKGTCFILLFENAVRQNDSESDFLNARTEMAG